MTVTWMWVGRPSSSGAKVSTKVTSTSNVRLAVSTSSTMSSPTYFGPVTPTAQFVASVNASGLAADTRYWFQIEHGGVLDTTYTGKFKTLPSAYPMTYVIATGSCAGSSPLYPGVGTVLASTRLSNHPVFSAIRRRDPLMFVHTGDMHYYDLSSGSHGIAGGASVANYRRAYDDVFLQTQQHQLFREVPTHYTWDDHDFIGNDKRGTEDTTSAGNAFSVYKEVNPTLLPNPSNGIEYDFQIGRTHFVMWDCRKNASANSAVDNSSKTMLGSTQKTWFSNLLDNSTAEAMVVFTSSQWNYTNHTDSWDVFTTERTEIINMINTKGWANRICMVTGDRHSSLIAPRNGASSEGGTWPYMMASSFDSSPSGITVSPDYTEFGVYRGQYGLIHINDTGSGPLAITLSAWRMDRLVGSTTFTTAGEDGFTLSQSEPPAHVLGF